MRMEYDVWLAAGQQWLLIEQSSRKRRRRIPCLSSGITVANYARDEEPRYHFATNGEDEDGDEGNVDGCPEVLLPGALTRRLSACRPFLNLPPSLPPVPPSNPRLAPSSNSSLCALFSPLFFDCFLQRSRLIFSL